MEASWLEAPGAHRPVLSDVALVESRQDKRATTFRFGTSVIASARHVPLTTTRAWSRWASALLLAASGFSGVGTAWGMTSAAFFYGVQPPVDELSVFDIVVLHPDYVAAPPGQRQDPDKWFAYVSLGEVDPGARHFRDIPASWLKGRNPGWGSAVVDQAQPAWPRFVVEHMIAPLWARGYRGFFLDTLDSYQLVATTAEERARQEQGLVAVVELIKRRFPDARLIVNRGFEILPAIREHVLAVVAESLFKGWDAAAGSYRDVPAEERDWLVRHLNRVRSELGLPVIVIDYVPPRDRQNARTIAARIARLGFVPWITNSQLDILGVGQLAIMPRKVLMLYSGAESGLRESALHRFLAMPLNYLGYVPEYRDVREPLPQIPLAGRYAGIVTWFNSAPLANADRFREWITSQAEAGMRIAVLGEFGFTLRGRTAEILKITEPERAASWRGRLALNKRSRLVGFEVAPLPDPTQFTPLQLADRHGEAWLQIIAGDGARQDAVALTSWGGYALNPFAVVELPNGSNRWVIDPFEFLSRALRLEPMPVPDVSTENGRRLLITHVDGDGFANRVALPGSPFAGEVIRRKILEHYRVPTTVSIIQGEIAANGLHPQLSPILESIAREIFRLPHVEIASHSYSHPFSWRKLDRSPDAVGYNLAIPGYRYDPETEIHDSIRYINDRLAPPGKQTKIFLWTGACDPAATELAIAQRSGVVNMNGGDTLITETNRSLTAVAPLGLLQKGYFQVYAPNQNENLYTNGWTGPFYGYRRAIETFQLTELPRRLKPINIYYHFFSATEKAGLIALRQVYDWTLAQRVFPTYASEYGERVLDFNRAVIARDGKGWLITNHGSVRQLRMPVGLGYPDLAVSVGVTGHRQHEEERYVHLGGNGHVRLRLRRNPGVGPYLADANGRVSEWRRNPGGLSFRLQAHVPLRFAVGALEGCNVRIGGALLKPISVMNGIGSFELPEDHAAKVTVACKRNS